jgi:DNA-binding NarL/FixJ family response regulator
VRHGIVKLIEEEPDLAVCCQAEDVRGALALLADSEPAMAIVDISLKRSSGLELVKEMKTRFPELPVLVLSMHDESLFAARALRAGAAGYVMKREAPGTLLTAIRQVLGGEIYVSDSIAARILHGFARGRARGAGSPMELLSDRELEVFQMIGDGMTTRRVAEALHLSVKTIESHREHIKEKLGLGNGNELLRHAMHWALGAGEQ